MTKLERHGSVLFLERSHPSVDHRHVDRVLANLERREFRNNEPHAIVPAGGEGSAVGGSRTHLSTRRMGLRYRASAAKNSVSKTLLGRTSKKSRKVAPVKEGGGDQQSDDDSVGAEASFSAEKDLMSWVMKQKHIVSAGGGHLIKEMSRRSLDKGSGGGGGSGGASGASGASSAGGGESEAEAEAEAEAAEVAGALSKDSSGGDSSNEMDAAAASAMTHTLPHLLALERAEEGEHSAHAHWATAHARVRNIKSMQQELKGEMGRLMETMGTSMREREAAGPSQHSVDEFATLSGTIGSLATKDSFKDAATNDASSSPPSSSGNGKLKLPPVREADQLPTNAGMPTVGLGSGGGGGSSRGDMKEDVKRTVYEIVLKAMEMRVQNVSPSRSFIHGASLLFAFAC